jgi:DNA-binding HxlR family transcriptional regulator
LLRPRILSKELKELEINKLVLRTPLNTIVLTVEYAETLKEVINAMINWGYNHRQTITK